MLSVLDVPPENCGYTGQQISEGLIKTGSSGVKQIGSDAQQLYYMLLQKKLIPSEAANASQAREHPEILKMRFDSKRSALNDMPLELYRELIPIMLEYTGGAVLKDKRKWVEMDILGELEKSPVYPFSVTAVQGKHTEADSGIEWEKYTWKEIEKRLEEVDTAILPCGSIEQHGPHLPLDVDYYDSMYLARKVAEACSNPKPFILPSLPYGVAYHHEDFKGTISITNHSLAQLVYDIGMSLSKNGIKKLIILNARHLRRVLTEYVAHYNTRRPHQSLTQDSPCGLDH